MAGGRNEDGDYLNQVIATKDGANYEFLTDLPLPLERACLVVIDSQSLFLAGGHPKTDKAYIFTKYDHTSSLIPFLSSII
jgi:hypothetical protein